MHHLPSRYIPCDGRLTASEYFKSTLPAWGATAAFFDFVRNLRFQSTLPAWGATNNEGFCVMSIMISIHAPRRGSDHDLNHAGGRRKLFQSTLPAGGATAESFRRRSAGTISIHAPRRGSDLTGSRGKLTPTIISIHAPRRGSDTTT